MSRTGWLIAVGFTFILALISLPNHYHFRTYGDTAYYLQMCEFYLKGRFFYGHLTAMSPYADAGIDPPTLYLNWSVLLAVPFYLAGKAWGLLLFQLLCFFGAGVGIYRIAAHWLGPKPALWTLLHYFGMWGLYSAAAFEFHEVAIAVAALPWSLYSLLRGKPALALLSWLIVLGSKELFGLWGVFFWTGWAWLFWKEKPLRKNALLLAAISLGYAGLLLGVAYPYAEKEFGVISRTSLYYAYLAEPDPLQVLYRQLEDLWGGLTGSHSMGAIFASLLRKPKLLIVLLFESPHPLYMGIKTELHGSVLLAGGWAFFLGAWPFLWILLPVYFYKLLAANYFMWGTVHHYSLEFALVLPLAVAWVVYQRKMSPRLLMIGALLSHATNLALLDSRLSKWYEPERHRFYQLKHYQSPYSYKAIHEGLQKIPPEAPVSALSCLLPHLPMREGLYHFPSVRRAEYLALLEGEQACSWPMEREAYKKFLDSLDTSAAWEKLWHRDQLRIYRRRPIAPAPTPK